MNSLHESIQTKDAELLAAQQAGSLEMEGLRSDRQQLADNMAVAQQQLQVMTAHHGNVCLRHSVLLRAAAVFCDVILCQKDNARQACLQSCYFGIVHVTVQDAHICMLPCIPILT